MVAPTLRRHFTVDDYYRMAESGILTEADRVELIEGEIVNMSPMGAPHAECVNTLTDLLVRLVDEHARVRTQCPVRLSAITEPEPDVAVVHRRSYRTAHPTPADILLLIEVADSSLDYDRTIKAPLYAREGIPEVWIVAVLGETVERYSEPTAEGYRDVRIFGRGDTVTSSVLPTLSLSVEEILGEGPE